MNDSDLTVALTQLVSSPEKDENLEKMGMYVKEASKRNADLIAFPEGFMFHHSKEIWLQLQNQPLHKEPWHDKQILFLTEFFFANNQSQIQLRTALQMAVKSAYQL